MRTCRSRTTPTSNPVMVRPGICVASALASLNSPAPMLVGIDGAKALCKAVIDVVDRSLGQCEGVAGMARACRCVRRHFDGRIRTVCGAFKPRRAPQRCPVGRLCLRCAALGMCLVSQATNQPTAIGLTAQMVRSGIGLLARRVKSQPRLLC
jgi:hypothetical protein